MVPDLTTWLRLVQAYEDLLLLWARPSHEQTDEVAAKIIDLETRLSDLKEQLGLARTAAGIYLVVGEA